MNDIQSYLQSWRETAPRLYEFGINALIALLILFAGWVIARSLRRGLRKGQRFGIEKMDPTLRPMLAGAIFYIILAVAVYAALRRLGVDATSLLAVFGAAGLAIGLGLKDTLSNIAAGIMILVLRPLNVGEYITTPQLSGSVVELGLFATTIRNDEGLINFVPNRLVWNGHIKNFGRHSARRFIADLTVGYDADLQKCQKLLLSVLQKARDVQDKPAIPECHIMNFSEHGIAISCRCWLPGDNWLARKSELNIALKAALDKAQITVAVPRQIVTVKNAK